MKLNKNLCNIVNQYLHFYYVKHNMPLNEEEFDYTLGIYDNMDDIITDIHCHIDDLFDQDRLQLTDDDINEINKFRGFQIITAFPIVKNQWLEYYNKNLQEYEKLEEEYIIKSNYNMFPIIDYMLLEGYEFKIEVLNTNYKRLAMYNYKMYMFYLDISQII